MFICVWSVAKPWEVAIEFAPTTCNGDGGDDGDHMRVRILVEVAHQGTDNAEFNYPRSQGLTPQETFLGPQDLPPRKQFLEPRT